MSISLDRDKEWLQHVRRIPSPNRDDRAGDTVIDAIVVHGISLPPKEYGGPYIDQLFTNQLDPADHPYFQDVADLRVSAHVLINRAGEITQYVPFSARARHAGVSEFQGRQDCNEFSIGIELEGCDDEPYEKRQYEVLADKSHNLSNFTEDELIDYTAKAFTSFYLRPNYMFEQL